MNKYILFSLVLLFILAVDFVFLTILMKGFYDSQLKAFSRTVRLWSGLAAWALIALGIVVLVIPNTKSYPSAAIYGAIFGLVLYGVYDFSNYAILKDYTIAMTAVDLVWGIFLCTLSSMFAFFMNSF